MSGHPETTPGDTEQHTAAPGGRPERRSTFSGSGPSVRRSQPSVTPGDGSRDLTLVTWDVRMRAGQGGMAATQGDRPPLGVKGQLT